MPGAAPGRRRREPACRSGGHDGSTRAWPGDLYGSSSVTTAVPTAPTGSTPAKAGQPLLELRSIDKNFGAVQALVDINLEVPGGQVTALAGDNGAGKSVLIKCIAGIHSPDGGQMLWEGEPVHVRTPRDAAALGIETGYQDLALFDHLDLVQT